jgi:hypothetical protein
VSYSAAQRKLAYNGLYLCCYGLQSSVKLASIDVV